MTDNPKITKISDARQRATVQKKDKRSGASSGSKGSDAAYERAMRKQKGAGGAFTGTGAIRWYHYIQLLLFLGLVAWFMKSCSI